MILVMGLGNPGKQYEKSRHNVGFFTIEMIRQKLGVSYLKEKNYEYFDYLISSPKGVFEKFGKNLKVKFLRPLTFMNLSGDVFNNLYQNTIDALIVVCDNIDLAFAKLRFKFSGSSAGHNGLKSIIGHYRLSNDFYRLYIGCGRKENMDARSLVLAPFSDGEEKTMNTVCKNAGDIILNFLDGGDEEKTKQLCSAI